MFWLACLLIYLLLYLLFLRFLYVRGECRRWFPGFYERLIRRPQGIRHSLAGRADRTVHLLVMTANLFNPADGMPCLEEEDRRLVSWQKRFGEIAARYRDAGGQPPRQTWFVPAGLKRMKTIRCLTEMAMDGLGEIEICIRRQQSGQVSLAGQVREGLGRFVERGSCFWHDPVTGAVRRSFGVLVDPLSDGGRMDIRGGLTDADLEVLGKEGCYGDFSPAVAEQPYHILPGTEDHAAAIRLNGTVGMDISSWRRILLPRSDTGEISAIRPASRMRIRMWGWSGFSLTGNPDWLAVRLYVRGCEPGNEEILLGKSVGRMYQDFERAFNSGSSYCLHYVTARELTNIIRAAEAGCTGDPSLYRDRHLPKYASSRIICSRPSRSTLTGSELKLEVLQEGAATIVCRDLPVCRIQGTMKTVALRYDGSRSLKLILTGQGAATIGLHLNSIPSSVSGGRITEIRSSPDGSKEIDIKATIPGYREIIIDGVGNPVSGIKCQVSR